MINNLQVLRGVAASLVVLFHTINSVYYKYGEVGYFSVIHTFGEIGVDIFFVISGFIMIYIQDVKKRSSVEFLTDRVIRIVPLYWLVTLFICAVYILNKNIFGDNSIESDDVLSSMSFSSYLFLDEFPILKVGWTLDLEMFFYVVMAIGIALSRNFFFPVSVLLLAAAYSFGETLFLEFYMGMLFALMYPKIKTRLSVSSSVVLLIFSVFLIFMGHAAKEELDRVVSFGVPAAALVWCALNATSVPEGYFTRLGDVSYSLYLTHPIVIAAFIHFLGKLSEFMPVNSINAETAVVLCSLLCVFVSFWVHFLVEKPVHLYLKSKFG